MTPVWRLHNGHGPSWAYGQAQITTETDFQVYTNIHFNYLVFYLNILIFFAHKYLWLKQNWPSRFLQFNAETLKIFNIFSSRLSLKEFGVTIGPVDLSQLMMLLFLKVGFFKD